MGLKENIEVEFSFQVCTWKEGNMNVINEDTFLNETKNCFNTAEEPESG